VKKLRVTKVEYDEFLYPAVAACRDEDLAQLRLTNKVLDLLEARGVSPEMENGVPKNGGQPWYKLNSPAVEIELEDVQAAHVVSRLKQVIPTLQAWRARQILPLIDQLTKEDI
jgi:hypothetical protein